MIGNDAPKTLKEKLAEKEEKPMMPRKASQKSLAELNGGEKGSPPQMGENTVEMAAIVKLMDDVDSAENRQQGQNSAPTGSLAERWL